MTQLFMFILQQIYGLAQNGENAKFLTCLGYDSTNIPICVEFSCGNRSPHILFAKIIRFRGEANEPICQRSIATIRNLKSN